MTMRALVPLFVACLALAGCPGQKTETGSTASESGSGGSGGGLLHDIKSEMFGSSKATRTGVALDVYYDVSGSSTNLKKPLGKLLEQVADTYPDAVPFSYSFYGNACNVQGTGVANVQSLRRANKAWVASNGEDKVTNLSAAFKHIREGATDEPKTQFSAIIVSDGGFEDQDAARAEFKKLKEVDNLRLLIFVGVHTKDNAKFEHLKALTKGDGGEPGGLTVEFVTDENSESSIQDARDALKQVVSSAKKVD